MQQWSDKTVFLPGAIRFDRALRHLNVHLAVAVSHGYRGVRYPEAAALRGLIPAHPHRCVLRAVFCVPAPRNIGVNVAETSAIWVS